MKYVLGVAGVLLLTILAVIIIVSRGEPSRPATLSEVDQKVELADYVNKDARISFTEQGRIVAQEDHRTIVISVTQNERVIEIYKGYDKELLKRERFDNTGAAYSTFLKALEGAGFAVTRESLVKDPAGVCPQGRRYEYELEEDNEDIVSLWNTTCGSRLGTMGGNSSLVQRLFRDQIPDYRKLTQGVQL